MESRKLSIARVQICDVICACALHSCHDITVGEILTVLIGEIVAVRIGDFLPLKTT